MIVLSFLLKIMHAVNFFKLKKIMCIYILKTRAQANLFKLILTQLNPQRVFLPQFVRRFYTKESLFNIFKIVLNKNVFKRVRVVHNRLNCFFQHRTLCLQIIKRTTLMADSWLLWWNRLFISKLCEQGICILLTVVIKLHEKELVL